LGDLPHYLVDEASYLAGLCKLRVTEFILVGIIFMVRTLPSKIVAVEDPLSDTITSEERPVSSGL
jgi:hypothetical protein